LFAGKNLLTKDGEKPAAEVLKDKYVGIYFSAHWCPPCRGFTPALATAYTETYKAKNLEIVFVSSDRDEAAFNEYYAEMPWTALPFADRDAKQALSSKFKVSGIPSFVVLDPSGELVTKNGRGKIQEGAAAAQEFPDGWKPLTKEELLAQLKTVDHAGTVTAAPATRYLLLYFSAHWCGPCQNFTPKFAERYAMLKAKEDMEVVFVSSDRDEASFDSYFKEMPWKALPYAERGLKEKLSEHFSVSGIPTVIVLERAADGKYALVNDDAVQSIMADEDGSKFPYHPPLVWDAEVGLGPINELPCVVALCEHADEATKTKTMATLNEIAEKMKSDDPKLGFICFTSKEGRSGHVGKILRGKAAAQGVQETDGTYLIMVDVQGDKGAKFGSDVAGAAVGEVEKWIETFMGGADTFAMQF